MKHNNCVSAPSITYSSLHCQPSYVMSHDSSNTESLTISKILQLADDTMNWVMYSTRLPIDIVSKTGYKRHLDSQANKSLTLKVIADFNGKLQVIKDSGVTVTTQADVDNCEKLINEWET